MRSRLVVLAFLAALVAAAALLVRWQGPGAHVGHGPKATTGTPQNQAHYASTPAHQEASDSEDLWSVSTLNRALNDSDVTPQAETERVKLFRELAASADPSAIFRTEARVFRKVADANRFLQEQQFRCQVSTEGFQEGQAILVGWMEEITVSGERAQVTFRGRPCAALRLKGERYGSEVRPVLKLALASQGGTTGRPALTTSQAAVYLTGFDELSKATHRISLEEIVLPDPDAKPAWNGWVILPALHAHVCQRVQALEGPAVFRAINLFSIKFQWAVGPPQTADPDTFILNDHFNVVVTRDGSPFLCFHAGPWVFTPDPEVL